VAAIALPERQQTDAWRKRRHLGVGSADAPVIAGVAPWGDIRTLFAEKVGWAAPVIETRPMSWGRHLEPAIAAAYADETGRKLRRVNRLLQHRALPWMLASLDRVVVGEQRIVEIKTARFANENWGAAGSDEMPDHVRIQVEHQMAVTGYEIADVVVLFAGSDLRIYTIATDIDVRADLLSLELAFWNAVQAKSLPADLMDLGPRPVPLREGEVAASETVAGLVAQLRAARTNFDQVEAVKKELEAELRAELTDIAAVRGDGFRISYRPNKDSVKVGWEEVAGAYRGALEGLVGYSQALRRPVIADKIGAGDDFHIALDAGELALRSAESLFTTTAPGIRPLRITYSKPTDEEPL